MFCKPPHPVYIVLFRGDDTDFVGNQEIIVKITTERNISGCKAYFKYMGNIQTFDEIPENKELHLVFSHEQTKEMPLGTWDAELYLIDENGKRMTVNNRIHMLVTNSVREAYCPDDPQAVSVVISANKYIEDAEVSADGKTLTLTKKDGTEVSFSGGGGGGGGGGTNDYNDLENKPSINGATLTGNVNLATPEQLSSKADLVDGKVPANQLPSYVDDVLEYDSVSAFPSTGEDGKIYVAKDTNKTYRWGGTQYVEISQSLALGETSETAYPGDKGKAAAEKADAAYSAAESLADGVNSLAGTIGTHIRDTNNPHKVTAAQVGALPIIGGTLTGDLAVGEAFAGSRTLSIASDNGAQGIVLQGGTSNGEGGSVIIGGSSGRGGTFRVEGGGGDGGTMFVGGSPFTGGKLTVQGGGERGGSIEVTEAGASIKKNGKEVATEEQLNAKADKATTLAGYGITDGATKTELNAKADKSALAAKADKATTLAGYGITDGATKTELAALTAKVEYPLYAVPPTGVLKDRAINTTSLASVTVPENFTDLLIRASVTSSLSVTMPDEIATKYGDTFPGEAGEYLITITKTGAAEAYVRTIKLEVA